MFEKPVDTVKVYGAKKYIKPTIQTYFEPVTVKTAVSTLPKDYKKPKSKYTQTAETFNNYQELRKTQEFKRWWWTQKDNQKGLCFYCFVDLDNVLINVEHIIPMSAGGSNDYSNLVLACQPCNKEKGSKVFSKKKVKQLKNKMKDTLEKKELLMQLLPLMTDFELKVELQVRDFNKKTSNKSA